MMKNKLKIQLLALFLLLNLVAFSQTVPEFKFTLTITDFMGNKDSVEIGYDPAATDTTDIAFGETESPITTPFDSLFEIKLSTNMLSYSSNPRYANKRVILNKNNLACIPNGSAGLHTMMVIILVRAKPGNFPLSFTYNYSSFTGSTCHDSTTLSPFSDKWVPGYFPYYNFNSWFGMFTIPRFYSAYGYIDSVAYMPIYQPGGGIGYGSVYLFRIYLSTYDFIFKHLTSGIQVAQDAVLPARVYPVPARNEVKADITEPAWCYITDMSGKTVQNIYLQAGTNSIDISNLSKGLYIMRLQGRNKFYQQKLVVE